MPLVSSPAGSNLTDAQLLLAEALVAGQLGIASLEGGALAESGVLGSSGLIVLTHPCVSLQTLTLSGAPAAGILRGPWTVDVSALTRGQEVPYTISYTWGWTVDTLPPGLRAAILLTAEAGAAAAGRVGLKGEGMGPVSYQYTDTAALGSLPTDALALLRPWLPLRF